MQEKLKSSLTGILTVLCDLMLLNILFLLCALPVLTLGPAACALFSVTLKLVREETVSPVRDFFRAFRENFRPAFLLGLGLAAGILVVYSDIVYALSLTGTFRMVFLIVSGIVAAVLLIYGSYVFALQAHYENRLSAHIRNAFLLAFCAPGRTVLMWLLYGIPAAILLLLPAEAAAYLGSLLILLGVSAPVYAASHILRGIFDRFTPA